MKKHLILFAGFAVLVTLVGASCEPSVPTQNRVPAPQQPVPIPTPNPTPSPSTTTLPTSNETQSVSIALIAVGIPGSGAVVGCGDSTQRVTVMIPKTTAPLAAALTELLSVKDQYYGQSGLYNALYQSALSLESVSIDNTATAHIRLNGTIKLGGMCDIPRVKAQITDTATQFESVKTVNIRINDKPIDEVLSLK